jgi:hypothetical protein
MDDRMRVRLALGCAQDANAQSSGLVIQTKGAGHLRRAFRFYGVEHNRSRWEAAQHEVIQRGQHPGTGPLRTRDDKSAATAVPLDHAVGNEHVECRTNREAADAELLRQFFIGWNLIANAPVTVREAGAERLEDLEVGWETHALNGTVGVG